jgi:outer membrane protein assembly factor BamB
MKTQSLTKLLLATALFAWAGASAADYWPQFRGPNGAGISDSAKPPVHFGPGSNELWHVKVPAGLSSPCVWGHSIFLTAFNDGKLSVLAVDRKSGKQRWEKPVPAAAIEKYHLTEGSPAASTCATDGRNVVSYFGSCGLVCHDFSGKEVWRLELPTVRQGGDFGSGASPIIVGDVVVVNRDQGKGSELIAVNLKTGKIAWHADRADLSSGYSTPVVWKGKSGEEIVLPGYTQLRAYDLKTGKEIWRVAGLPAATCTTPVLGDGLLFFAGWAPGKDMPMPSFDKLLEGGPFGGTDKNGDGVLDYDEASDQMKSFFGGFDQNEDKRLTREEWSTFLAAIAKGENSLLAVKPGGKGDITASHVAWKQKKGLPYVPSPLWYRGFVYIIKDGGMLSRFAAKSGEPTYEQERIGTLGSYYASPVAADGRLYVVSLDGVLTVLAAGDKPEVLGRAEFKERIAATPALVDKTIYVRSAENLWAFAK